MKIISRFFSNKLIPFLNKCAENKYIKAFFEAQKQLWAMVMIGSLVTLYSVIQKYVPFLPDLSIISKVTFGLMALYMSYLVPYHLLLVHKNESYSNIAGFTGMSSYILLVYDTLVTKDGKLDLSLFGADGTLMAIVIGIIVMFIFLLYGKRPYQVKNKYNSFIVEKGIHYIPPILTSIFLVYFFNLTLKAPLYAMLLSVVRVLASFSNTAIGFSLFVFVPAVLYSAGANSWTYASIVHPLVSDMSATSAQVAAASLSLKNTLIPFIYLGGHASAFGLVILLLGSKAKKLRNYGKIFIVPSIFNIGEPILFTLIAWNPLLMVPMWLNALVLPLITYFGLTWHIFPAPVETFTQWYIPIGISAFMATKSFMSIVLVVINLVVSTAIWYPFFKVYEKKVLEGKDMDATSEASTTTSQETSPQTTEQSAVKKS